MAKPSWLNERIADEPIDRGQDIATDTGESPTVSPRIATIEHEPNVSQAYPDQQNPAAGQFPAAEIWGTRDEWKSKTEKIIDPETGIWTGRTRQIFLRTSECPPNMSIEEFLADLDWISSLVK